MALGLDGFKETATVQTLFMSDTQSNNRRIAKNTLLLYFRMLFTMAVSLYTSRVVLETLGVDDYGIYNVVGGVVAMFSVLSGSLSSAISRFITFELGRGDQNKLKVIFSTSVSIQIVLALGIWVIAEIAGVWFLNSQMNIPQERIVAANWVLQCSIITFMINLISVPYNATIIAHEKMSAFAYISILEVSLKLIVAYLLYVSSYDKLVVYAILLMLVALLIRLVYGVYCKRHFEEARYRIMWRKDIFKEMLGFAGWNFFGNACYLVNTQGVNMLINIYFGVAMNAARGIAVQVDGAILGFVGNFMTAVQPQITKAYASGDLSYMFKLVNKGTKFSFYIMCFLMIPVLLETDTILNIWLKNVPSDSAIFLRLVLFASMANALGNVLYYAIISTGDIKKYQLVVTSVGFLVFPLTWVAFVLGAHAATTYIIFGIVYLFLNVIRLRFLKSMLGFPVMRYVKEVILPVLIVGSASVIMPLILVYFISPSILRFILVTIISIMSTSCCVYLFGLTKGERSMVVNKVNTVVFKIVRKWI